MFVLTNDMKHYVTEVHLFKMINEAPRKRQASDHQKHLTENPLLKMISEVQKSEVFVTAKTSQLP